MNELNTNIPLIYGAGGKGGGGGATEAPNTMQSDSIVRVLEVISEGEIEGIVGDLKGIYFNSTPLQTEDGANSFENITVDVRNGLPDQPYMAGFPAAETIHDIGAEFTTTTPYTYTVTDADVDAVKITITLPSGLTVQNTSNGDLNGSEVTFAFDVAAHGGVLTQVAENTIQGKTTSQFGKTYRIERPAGTGLWTIRIRRITADATTTNVNNKTAVGSITEVQDVKLQYNDVAYVGLAVSAKSVGGNIPNRAYLTRGVICRVPVNYDTTTCTYTGIWNGDFKRQWTNNPAWILFEILTNDRFGMGEYITDNEIDLYSFYDAAVYNDELVPDGQGGYERRFTFNTQLMNQEDAVKVIQQMAGAFNATLLREGSIYRLQQDRPSSPVQVITNANVINGVINVVETPIQSRRTAVNAKYLNKKNFYKTQITTVTASEEQIARYGYIEADLECFGVTNESQAIRTAKWHIETELNQLKIARWQMSFNGFMLRLGDVVSVWDENYTGTVASGRILSTAVIDGTHIEITFDRAIDLPTTGVVNYNAGDEILSGTYVDGSLLHSIVIEHAAGQLLPEPGSIFFVTNSIEPRQFRINKIVQSDTNLLDIEAIEHDPTKYARIEQGITVDAPIYSGISFARIQPPTNITFRVNSYVNSESIRRDLLVSWSLPSNESIVYSTIQYRVNGGNWETVKADTPSYEIKNIVEGTYDVRITVQGLNGTSSTQATASYAFTLNGGTGSVLLPVTNLYVANSGGSYAFTERDLNVEWLYPSANDSTLAALKDFRVDVKDTLDNIIRTDYVERVQAGETQTYRYSFETNKLDSINPKRALKVTVYCRDAENKLSLGTTQSFNNPVPDAPTIDVKAGVKSLMIETNRSTADDYAGTIIWASTATNFTPSDANKIYQGANTFYIYENVTGTWYFKAAHYDSFGSTGLNTSSQGVGTASSAAGITTVTALPANPAAVDGQQAVYLDVANTSTRGLYAWNGTSWAYTRDGANLIANSVTADKLTVANLAAITANMGNVTAGTLTLDQTGYVRGGATAFSSGTGFWQGYDSGAYKWRVGTPGSARAEWNGTAFNIYDGSGNLTISSGAVQYGFIQGKPTSLSAINSTESTKLAGILDNAGKVIDGGTGTGPGQRQCDDPPSYYPIGKTLQFKWSSSLGISDGGSWITVETNKQYGDNSGGMMTQWAYAQNGSTYKRSGFPANAAWSTGWVQDLDRTVYTGDLNATWGATNSTLNVGLGVNLLPNTEWLNNNIAPCVMGWNPSSCILYSGAITTPDWVPTGGNALLIYQSARNGNQYNIGADIYPTGGYQQAAYGIPVVVGKRYELSCKVANHRADIGIYVEFFDSNNGQLGGFSTTQGTARTSGGKTLANWAQLVCFGYAPANAAYASIYFRKFDTDAGQTDSYAWFTQPHFGIATDAQTVASAYTPGTSYAALTSTWSGVTGSGKPQDNATVGAAFGVNITGQITSANASTYIANAAIGSAMIGSVALVGADAFSVKTATTGERVEMNGQVIKVFDSNNVVRVKIGNLNI